jgi:hypothetical protein
LIYPDALPSIGNSLRGSLGVPISLVIQRPGGGTLTTIRELRNTGQFTMPLVGYRNIINGSLSRSVNQKSDVPRAIDERVEFSRRSPQAAVMIGWFPLEKRKGVPSIRIYDMDNRMLSEIKMKKAISLSPNKSFYSIWDIQFANLSPGIYRIDVLLDSDAVWRRFFRIVE